MIDRLESIISTIDILVPAIDGLNVVVRSYLPQ